MNYAEQKKLTAAANKLLKKKNPKKKPVNNLLFKIFTQTQGHFIPNHAPNCTVIKTWDDLKNKNRQTGNFEYLPKKTYYKLNLKEPGIYFYQHMEIVLRKDFYYKPGGNGFFSLTPDGKIHPMTEEEAQKAFSN